ncbi:C-type lectin 37Db-like [Cloeon dipterum]|uniref:C-type lectin 37Db-like n=1 Tax=Cloeon dipterum TaxID=197152 RepID=UPI0032206C48
MMKIAVAICEILLLGLSVTAAGPEVGINDEPSLLKFDYGNSSYILYHTAVNWYTARNKCRQQGLDLVSIETEGENTAILNAISSFKIESFWTAGSDKWQEDSWYWDSTGLDFGPTQNWTPGQPDHSGNCLLLWANVIGHLWDDADCLHLNRYICESQTYICSETSP